MANPTWTVFIMRMLFRLLLLISVEWHTSSVYSFRPIHPPLLTTQNQPLSIVNIPQLSLYSSPHHPLLRMTSDSTLWSSPEDVWSPNTPLTDLFDTRFLLYLKRFYDANADDNGLSFESFYAWSDVRAVLEEESIDASCLRTVWAECLLSTRDRGDMSALRGDGLVTFDAFVRINSRLESVIDDTAFAKNSLSSARNIDEYHKKLFLETTSNEPLMSFPQFVSCAPIAAALDMKVIRLRRLRDVWEALPKLPLGAFYSMQDISRRYSDNDVSGGVANGDVGQSDGIAIESFQCAMQDLLDSLLEESEQ